MRQIDGVASEAVRWNVQERNIYIGVRPRMPDAPALKRSSDKHVLCVPWLWCDWDAPGTAENASNLWSRTRQCFA